MDQKDFNRGLDNYLGKVRKKEGSPISFSDVLKFGKKQRNFKDVEFKDTESVIVEEEPGFMSKLFDALKPKRSLVEESEEMEEEEQENIEISVKEDQDLEELEEDIGEIEKIEKEERNRVGKLHRLLGKLRFMNLLKKSKTEDLEDDMEVAELKSQATVNDVRALIDFSVGLLQKIPSKAFKEIKVSKEFIEYKDLVKKYVKDKIDTPSEEEVKEELGIEEEKSESKENTPNKEE
jgi:hypothetical protein